RFLVSVDDERGQVDVVCCHKSFRGIEERDQQQIAWIVLNAILGEDSAEVWIDDVQCRHDIPRKAVDAGSLAATVADLADPRQEARWTVLEGQHPRGPLLAVSQAPLHPLRWPHLDTHAAIDVPVRTVGPQGWPADESLKRTGQLQRVLESELDSSGELVA